MKKILTSLLMLSATFGLTAQSVEVEVKNQEVIGTDFYFDLFVTGTSGADHLGNSDFVFTFNNANFSSPVITLEASTSDLIDQASGADVSSSYAISADIPTSGVNQDEIKIELQAPFIVSDLTTDVAYINAETRIGRFKITNVQTTSSAPALVEVTTGSKIKTDVFYYQSTSKQRRVTETYTMPSALGTSLSAATNAASTFPTATTLNITWDAVAGAAGYVVLVNEGGTLSNEPAGTVALTGDSDFSTANGLGGSDDKIVYSGATNSVTLTNVTSSNAYDIKIYAFDNTVTGFDEVYSSAATISVTLSPEPTTGPSAIVVSNVSTTGFDIAWTGGNGSDNLIIITPSSGSAGTPSDGTSYTADANYSGSGDTLGDGTIVLAGTTNPLSVSGLTVASSYEIRIIEYNETTGTPNYYTGAPATATQYTMFDEPAPLATATNRIGSGTSFTSTAQSATEIDLSWTDPSNSDLQYIVIARPSSASATVPTAGVEYTANAQYSQGSGVGSGYVVYNGDGSDLGVSVTDLAQNEDYVFDVYAYTGSFSDSKTFNYDDVAALADGESTWITVGLSAWLEGPFNGTDMNSDLQAAALIPGTDPYNGSITGFTAPSGMVDYVQVELVDAANNTTAEAQAADYTLIGILNDDGSIVGEDGNNLTFQITSSGNFFVKIRHRNHLSVMSDAVVQAGATPQDDLTIDFTASGAAYGTNATVEVTTGEYALYAGNADNSDEVVDSDDFTAVWNATNAAAAYSTGDVDMDGFISASDRSQVFNNKNESAQISN